MPKCIYRYDLPYQPENYKPFVYEICFKPKDTNHKDYGKRYIGSLYRNNTSSGTAHPDFFWVEDGYYTSSYPIQVLLNEHGPESFEVVDVTSFTTKQETYDYEKDRLIETNAAKNPMYFNQHNNNGPANSLSRKSVMKSAKTKKKKRDKMIVDNPERFEEIESARKEKERKTKEERFVKKYGIPFFAKKDNLYSYQYFFALRHRYKIETWPTFSHFVADMGLRPHKGYLFRYDLNKPYSKENCYWKIATKSKLRTVGNPSRRHTQETIDKIKKSKIGQSKRILSEEHKKAIGRGNKGKVKDAAWREKIAKTLRSRCLIQTSNQEAANSVEFVSVLREALKEQSQAK